MGRTGTRFQAERATREGFQLPKPSSPGALEPGDTDGSALCAHTRAALRTHSHSAPYTLLPGCLGPASPSLLACHRVPARCDNLHNYAESQHPLIYPCLLGIFLGLHARLAHRISSPLGWTEVAGRLCWSPLPMFDPHPRLQEPPQGLPEDVARHAPAQPPPALSAAPPPHWRHPPQGWRGWQEVRKQVCEVSWKE